MDRSFANKDNLPTLAKRKRDSRVQLDFALNTFATLQSINGGEQAFGVRRRTQKISGLLKGLILGEREHHDSLITVSGDNYRRIVLANTVYRSSKILSRSRISDGSHMDRILSRWL